MNTVNDNKASSIIILVSFILFHLFYSNFLARVWEIYFFDFYLFLISTKSAILSLLSDILTVSGHALPPHPLCCLPNSFVCLRLSIFLFLMSFNYRFAYFASVCLFFGVNWLLECSTAKFQTWDATTSEYSQSLVCAVNKFNWDFFFMFLAINEIGCKRK
jgi:hypothetical protein